jgi:hypothetical protein
MFPSSGEEGKTPTLLGPLERAKLNHWKTHLSLGLSQCYDLRSASLYWNKAPIWGLWPNFYYCQAVAGLLPWGALSDKRTGLLFKIAAGPGQRSHSQVQVTRDSWPHTTVSDSRLPFSLPPTTRRYLTFPLHMHLVLLAGFVAQTSISSSILVPHMYVLYHNFYYIFSCYLPPNQPSLRWIAVVNLMGCPVIEISSF